MSWQTLNTRSILAHVLQPEGFQIALGVFEHAECKHLRECLIGRPPQNEEASKCNDLLGIEDVHSESRLVDGAYTRVTITWRGLRFAVTSGHSTEGDLLLLVEPDAATFPIVPPLLTVEASLLWNHAGSVERAAEREELILHSGNHSVTVSATSPFSTQAINDLGGAHATLVLDRPVGLCTGTRRDLATIRAALDAARSRRDQTLAAFATPELRDLAGALSSALGWTAVHDPASGQVVNTVSRVWASRNAGCVLFCWDSFLAAMMAASLGERALALANLHAITRPIATLGYVPNVFNAAGSATFGQSQPPVGAFALRYVANALGDPTVAAPFLDSLLTWNRWRFIHRRHQGFLCWGSRREPERVGGSYENSATGSKQGAVFESGLDNSPAFDDANYDEATGLLLLADVGLHSFYLRDCLDLAALMDAAGRTADAAELRTRADETAIALEKLWDERTGIYRDLDLVKNAFSQRTSPCHFYPLFTGLVPPDRAQRMVDEHLLDPRGFWGEHVIPSIRRDDPAYPEQDYWRGRIWAPLNFFVYVGLRTVGQRDVASELARKSAALLLRNWRERGFIGENFNADTGLTGERANSDPFNPWGALLALVGLLDAEAVPPLPVLDTRLRG